MVRPLSPKVAAAAALLLFAQSALAQAPRYRVNELPPLETAVGTMQWVFPWDLNNAGQVVGYAVSPSAANGRAAFVYSADHGMRDITPNGYYDAEAVAISDSGWIYGHAGFRSPFLYDPELRLDELGKNANGVLTGIYPFHLSDLNDAGKLAGCASDCSKPVTYTRDTGWVDYTDRLPPFPQGLAAVTLINDRGDLVMTVAHPGGFNDAYVLFSDERMFDLGNFGTRLNTPSGISNDRVVSGISRTAGSDPAVQSAGDDHAYFFTPDRGVVDIHQPRFRVTEAIGLAEDGVVWGFYYRGARGDRGPDGIFTYDSTKRRKRIRVEVQKRRLKRMFSPGTPGGLVDLGEVYANRHLEFVGEAYASDYTQRRFFFYSRSTGLVDLQAALDEAGYMGRIEEHVAVNDRGQILLAVERPPAAGSSRPVPAAVLLTPVR